MLRLLLLLAALPISAHAQPALTDRPAPARTTAYVEVLGNAGIASLNVDHLLSDYAGIRLGGFAFPLPERKRWYDPDPHPSEDVPVTLFVVAMGYRLIGPPQHSLELGGGLLVGASDDPRFDGLPRTAATFTLGFRAQPAPKRVGIRAGLTPIVTADRVLWRAGFSLSYGLPTSGFGSSGRNRR